MPSMHDMIDELNDIECPSYPPVDPGCGMNGCGFGSWIWILLILFYAGQGGCGGYAGNTGCCCNSNSKSCCCGNSGNNGLFGGLGNCGGGYLFLLVILFLCNGSFGCGNFGPNAGFNGACSGLL